MALGPAPPAEIGYIFAAISASVGCYYFFIYIVYLINFFRFEYVRKSTVKVLIRSGSLCEYLASGGGERVFADLASMYLSLLGGGQKRSRVTLRVLARTTTKLELRRIGKGYCLLRGELEIMPLIYTILLFVTSLFFI